MIMMMLRLIEHETTTSTALECSFKEGGTNGWGDNNLRVVSQDIVVGMESKLGIKGFVVVTSLRLSERGGRRICCVNS